MSAERMEYPKALRIYLELRQYPILARRIRERMRQEIFSRGIISPESFEDELDAKAIESQRMEGITNPLYEESAGDWAERLRIIRDRLTDFYFAYNLPHDLFQEIVQRTISDRDPEQEVVLSFNPELAPWNLLFAQAERYEALPPEEQTSVRHHLQEIIVVLTKGMISDQLAFVGIAREYFEIADLKEIFRRRIGRGKIGGKAAGIMLAWKILQTEAGGTGLRDLVSIPESYFIGADVFYDFLSLNGLHDLMNQKYLSREEITQGYERIKAAFSTGRFPPRIVQGLQRILDEVNGAPLIVRSSSLLEDNFGFSFSGKYDSFFCPNQGSPEENLVALQDAVRKVYASTLNPDALIYRRQRGLLDYDERMAILIQKVMGKTHQDHYFPLLAGVAFSRNPHRWTARIRPEAGFLRLVFGMGTRAVDRVANDYPRTVALSHPTLRPEISAAQIRRYSQHFVDLIDLKANEFKTVPLAAVLAAKIPSLRFLVSLEQDGDLQSMITSRRQIEPEKVVLTFDQLLRNTPFAYLMEEMLKLLETYYGRPVDVEFAADLIYDYPSVDLKLCLLQCRPLSSREDSERHQVPQGIPERNVLFTASEMVPHGAVRRIEYLVYIDPYRYERIPEDVTRLELARLVGRLNRRLEGHTFILMGPGRWGSANIELGVKVTYADIFNSRALVEIAMPKEGGRPEVSHGTHFFQDLVESDIFPLALYPGERGIIFNAGFLERAANALSTLLPKDTPYADLVKVIHLPSNSGGRTADLIMNTDEEKAICYLT